VLELDVYFNKQKQMDVQGTIIHTLLLKGTQKQTPAYCLNTLLEDGNIVAK
jgi:hypothetical protein